MQKPMERFRNVDEDCLVLARNGDTALIVRPGNVCAPFVVPLQHIEGETHWWQGKYFSSLETAFAYYQQQTTRVQQCKHCEYFHPSCACEHPNGGDLIMPNSDACVHFEFAKQEVNHNA